MRHHAEPPVVFGAGLGYRDVEFKAFGVPRGGLGARFEERLVAVRRLRADRARGDLLPVAVADHRARHAGRVGRADLPDRVPSCVLRAGRLPDAGTRKTNIQKPVEPEPRHDVMLTIGFADGVVPLPIVADSRLSTPPTAPEVRSELSGSVADRPKRPQQKTGDPQQAVDAGLKALGLAYMIQKLFAGSITEKVNAFRELPAGQEIGLYYATAEIALPFADNLVEGGASVVERLVGKHKGDIQAKFAQFAGQEQVANAMGMLENLIKPLDEYVNKAKQYAGPVTDKIKHYLPSAMNVADSATGMAAAGVDLMPVWSFLGGRLAAEACLLRARNG